MIRARASTAAVLLVASSAAWTPQTSGVTVRLRGVSAVNDRVVWASGASGTVLRTTDGGATWKTAPVPDAAQLDFRDIDAFSETIAYVMSIGNGEASRIYKTVDGGRHWALQLANKDPKIFLDAMAFWSPEAGVAFSDSVDGRFVIFMTTNGGDTWTPVAADRLPPALPNEGAYAASGSNLAMAGSHVWIGTTASRVLHSVDRGRTWSVTQTPVVTGASAGIFSITFRDALHGLVVGGDFQKEREAVDNAAVTADGGKTWTLVKGLTGYRSAVAYVPESKRSWIAVGPLGSDLSTDDGKSWTPVAGPGFHAFSVSRSGRVGWGVGERGAIARLATHD
ncbi:MAG: oxidoreductase [Acidobacteria bacterium]|nr:oxidoreductase [Acidobacteriota bacterium]